MAKDTGAAPPKMVFVPGIGMVEEGTGWGAPAPNSGDPKPIEGNITQAEIDLWGQFNPWTGMGHETTPGEGLVTGTGGTTTDAGGEVLQEGFDTGQPDAFPNPPPLPTEPPPGVIPDESGGAPPPGGGGGQPPLPGDGTYTPPNQPPMPPPGTPGDPSVPHGYNANFDPSNTGYSANFGPGALDNYSFDRYVPGQESPWGVPDVEGGNEEFYRAQFLDLLGEGQGFRERQRAAAIRGEEAAAAGPPEQKDPWAWLEGGLPDVRVAEGGGADGTPAGWGLSTGLEKGMTNQEVISQYGGQWSDAENAWWQKQPEKQQGSPWFASFDDPNEFMTKVRDNNPELSGENMAHYQKLANLMFSKTGGTAGAGGTPAGYAYLPGVGPGA